MKPASDSYVNRLKSNLEPMETRVIFIERSQVNNVKLKIIEFLMKHKIRPDSIRIFPQEIQFRSDESEEKREEDWCNELNKHFKGNVEFMAKVPEL